MNAFFKIDTSNNKINNYKKTNLMILVSNNEMVLLNHFQLFNRLIIHFLH